MKNELKKQQNRADLEGEKRLKEIKEAKSRTVKEMADYKTKVTML